jgi:hypothetical protein
MMCFDGMEELQRVHTKYLYEPLVEHWRRYGMWTPFDPKLFVDLLDHASDLLLRYSSHFLTVQHGVAAECSFNPGFRRFLNSQRAHPAARRMEWRDFHKAPIAQLRRHSLLLETLRKKNKKRPDGYRMTFWRYAPVIVSGVENQINEVVSSLKHLGHQCANCIDKTSEQHDELGVRGCFKPRECITRRPADLDWLAHTQIDRETDCLQASCLFQGDGQAMERAWCNFFFPGDGSLVIARHMGTG